MFYYVFSAHSDAIYHISAAIFLLPNVFRFTTLLLAFQCVFEGKLPILMHYFKRNKAVDF